MNIVLNGKNYETKENITVAELLEEKGISASQAVVEYNGVIVPKEEFSGRIIEPDAVLEVLRFVGGG